MNDTLKNRGKQLFLSALFGWFPMTLYADAPDGTVYEQCWRAVARSGAWGGVFLRTSFGIKRVGGHAVHVRCLHTKIVQGS